MLTQTKSEIAELREKYLEHLRNNRYSVQTIKNTDYALRDLEKYFTDQSIERIADVTTETVSQYNQHIRNHKDEETGKSYNISTITGKLQPVKYFFSWLTKTMVILYDPAKDMEITGNQERTAKNNTFRRRNCQIPGIAGLGHSNRLPRQNHL